MPYWGREISVSCDINSLNKCHKENKSQREITVSARGRRAEDI